MGLRDRYRYHDKNIFFITTTIVKWLPIISIGCGFEIVIESLCFCLDKYKSKMLGYVIMPNHLHIITYFPKSKDRSNFMKDFKKYTSTMLRKEVEMHQPQLLNVLKFDAPKRVFQVWQDRFDEVYLETCRILEIKLNYIHNNPAQGKWHLVNDPVDYSYSSMLFYETGAQGLISIDHYRDFV